MNITCRAFGDFEADLKRSDSGSIPDRKAWFLTLICSLDTFQSKNPSHPLPSMHFQPDEKRGERAQKTERREAKPRSEIQIWEERGFGNFRFEISETNNKFREKLFHRPNRLKHEAFRPSRRTWIDEKRRRTSEINLLQFTNSQFLKEYWFEFLFTRVFFRSEFSETKKVSRNFIS